MARQVITNGDTGLQVRTDLNDNFTELYEHMDKVDNSFYGDFQAYYGNTKLADDFQVESDWTSGAGTQSADSTNVKIGDFGLRITENDNTANTLSSSKNNISLDLTALNNGEASSTSDYIYFVFYVSDSTLVQNIDVSFDQASTYTGTNIVSYSITSSISTGWNYFEIPKSSFSTSGSGSFSGIQSMQVSWQSQANAINEYVTFQLIQLVKKDPSSATPNPFQRNGVAEANVQNTKWVIIKEFGNIVLKYIGVESATDVSLKFTNTYKNFIASGSSSEPSTSRRIVAFDIDSSNRIYAVSSSTTTTLTSLFAGVIEESNTVSLSIASNDVLDYIFKKSGSNVSLIIFKNKDYETPYEVKITSSLTNAGTLAIGNQGSGTEHIVYSLSITEISHAHHADISEVAKGLLIKRQSGAFVADELNYDELGIDTSNNRLYAKYSDTQVIYFAGTVV